jgi:glucokinase
MILSGDVGGTKTNLAIYTVDQGKLCRGRSGSFKSRDYGGLCEVIQEFIGNDSPEIEAAGFGVAGPVHHGRVKTTNLPWEVDGREIAARLNLSGVTMLNDLEAMAWGIELLGPEEVVTLQEGQPYSEGNAALIAAGTGLGQAFLVRHEGRLIPSACEGGHTDFAPNDPDMDAYLFWMRERLPHVSMERVASGSGLALVYKFFHAQERHGREPHHEEGTDVAKLVAQSARTGSCESCTRAFDLFIRCYGAEAGNLALKTGATAGLYVGGGVAAKNADLMQDGRFIKAFCQKGRYHEYMEKIPVRLILDQSTPLLGAALAVARKAGRVP